MNCVSSPPRPWKPVLSQPPPRDPKEPPAWLTRTANRLGDKSKGDFTEEWHKERAEAKRKAELAEQPMSEAELAAFRR